MNRVIKLRGSCEEGNEIEGFIKCGEFREWLRNCQLVKRAVSQAPSACFVSYFTQLLAYLVSKTVSKTVSQLKHLDQITKEDCQHIVLYDQ